MKLKARSGADESVADVVTMPWDAALAALASGGYDEVGDPRDPEADAAPGAPAPVDDSKSSAKPKA